MPLEELAAPGAGGVRAVPVPAVGQVHALRGRQAHGVDVVDEHDQAGQLHGLGQAEFIGRLDRVGGVGAGVGQGQDLGLAALRLQQERVARRQRMLDRAQHLAAAGLHHVGGVGLQRRAEGIVGRQEVPGLAAGLDHRVAGAARQRHGVVGVVQRIGRALLVGQRRRAGADHDNRFLLVGGHARHGQRGAGVGAADQHVQALLVEPLARLGRGDVGLVLVVGGDQLDLPAVDRAAHFLDGHADGLDAAWAVGARVHARQVGDETDPDDIVRELRLGGAGTDGQGGAAQAADKARDIDNIPVSSYVFDPMGSLILWPGLSRGQSPW